MDIEKRKQIILEFMKSELYVPMKEKELAIMMQVDAETRPVFKNALVELQKENKVEVSKRGKYTIAKKQVLIGTFISNAKGFGFVEIENATEDYFVNEEDVNGAFHKDIVEIELLAIKSGKRQEAKIVNIIEHGIKTLVGTYQKSKNFGFVVPDDKKIAQDIFVPKELSKRAVDGHKVVLEIVNYGKKGKKPEGRITEIIGHMNDPFVDIVSIIKGFDIPLEFSEKELLQAERVASEVSEKDMEGRKDLRDIKMVTIDGADAKDLDDAVSLSKVGDIYKLGVHIADVTNYVQENSALDKQALARATSVYLVDRVIPMLPHVLSNGMCSLNANDNRLALSCIMDITRDGQIVNYEITESVICVDERMTYTDVAAILDGDKIVSSKYKPYVEMFFEMKELSDILRNKRRDRGAIDFNSSESKIILDEEGKPIDIVLHERNNATMLIEDFMLAANETVAEHFYWLEMPFVYRTHDIPDAQRIEKLDLFIRNFGYFLKYNSENFHAKEFQKLLEEVKGKKEEMIVNNLTLRSMKQAKYLSQCTGHFGLACKYYCHFTSPIRRYPDLQIHRIIKESLRGKMTPSRISHYKEILDKVCTQCSTMERRAQEAERETDKCKKVQYMEDKLGQAFTGIISGMNAYGMYVELPNSVEGFVPASKMEGDYYEFKEDTYQFVGTHTKVAYDLGQEVHIVVYDVNKHLKTIDFILDSAYDEN